jgi:hypothetical protein
MTPEDYTALLLTVAGEIDPRYSPYGTDKTRKEIAQILQTIDNRRRSRGGSYSDVTGATNIREGKRPNLQYSTWNDEGTRATARANLAKYGPEIRSAVNDWVVGLNEAPLPTADHYYNPSIVNPGWAKNLEHGGVIGPHAFGTDPAAMGRIQAGLVDDMGYVPQPFEREVALAGGYPEGETQVAEADPGWWDYISGMFVTPAAAAELPPGFEERVAPDTRPNMDMVNTVAPQFNQERFGPSDALMPGMLAEPLPEPSVVEPAPVVYEPPFDPGMDLEDRPMVGEPMVDTFDHGGAQDYVPNTEVKRQDTSQQTQPTINPVAEKTIGDLLQASLGGGGLLGNLLRGGPGYMPNDGLSVSGLMRASPQFASAWKSGGVGLY